MKKKLLRTAATLMMAAGALSFAACNSDSNNDDDKPVIDLVDPATTVVTSASIKANGDRLWEYDSYEETFVATNLDSCVCTEILASGGWEEFADCFSTGTILAVDSTLHINLGTPNSNAPGFVSLSDQGMGGISTDPTAKLLVIRRFWLETQDNAWYLRMMKGSSTVVFMYADKPVTINGTIESTTFNGTLKAGWNTILYTENDPNPSVEDDETYSYTNCTLGTDYKWVVN